MSPRKKVVKANTEESDRVLMERMFEKLSGQVTNLQDNVVHEVGKIHKVVEEHDQRLEDQEARIFNIEAEGVVSNGRLDHIEGAVSATEQKFQDMHTQIAALQTETQMLQRRIESLPPGGGSGSTSGYGRTTGRGPPWAAVPREQRKNFVMGNLGWDLGASELEDNARVVLGLVGSSNDDFKELKSPFRYGSTVEIEFLDRTVATTLAGKVRDLEKEIVAGKKVFLKEATTSEERKPGKDLAAILSSLRTALPNQLVEDCPPLSRHLYRQEENWQFQSGCVDVERPAEHGCGRDRGGRRRGLLMEGEAAT